MPNVIKKIIKYGKISCILLLEIRLLSIDFHETLP